MKRGLFTLSAACRQVRRTRRISGHTRRRGRRQTPDENGGRGGGGGGELGVAVGRSLPANEACRGTFIVTIDGWFSGRLRVCRWRRGGAR